MILASTKEELHKYKEIIENYLKNNLKLKVKFNYQIFPIIRRGIDFVGYKIFHTHILLRKRIKTNFIRMVKYKKNIKSINSYKGWLLHANTINLTNKYLSNDNN